ncbi:MAG: ATP-binding protein, partial [bacterium]
MSIRSILLLILVTTMGLTLLFTYKLMEEHNELTQLGRDFTAEKHGADQLKKQLKSDLLHIFMLTDIAGSTDQLDIGSAAILFNPLAKTRKSLNEISEKVQVMLDKWGLELKPLAQDMDEQEQFSAVMADASSSLKILQQNLNIWLEEADQYLQEEIINTEVLLSLSENIVSSSVILEVDIDTLTSKGSQLVDSHLEREKERLWFLTGGSLLFLALLAYIASNVIAGPLERLSAASKAAEKPGQEFILPTGKFSFKEDGILAEAIASLVTARNSQQETLEAKVTRRDAELAHLNGMDQLGKVAGNVAHDFANFLTIVIGYAEISLKKELSDDLRKNIELILDAANGGKGVTEQLLKISRRSLEELNPVAIDPSLFVEQMEPLWKPFLGVNIQMAVESHGEVGTVFIEVQSLTQIIMNLVTNARDAMPDGGQIKIAVWNGSEFKEHPKPAHLDPTIEYSVIEVADEGTGIPDSMLEKLYQPYESTKDQGKGTGFGLSIVHNMVHDAGGGISFATEQGVGTSFQVWLPKFVATESNLTELNPAESKPVEGARLLLIEDESALREIATLALEAEGHDVTAAASGVVAIENHEDDLLSFDAVISDIRMPGMDGDEVIKRFRKQHRSLPVLFISAHSFREIEENLESSCPTLFLQKPFSIEDLNLRVHQL